MTTTDTEPTRWRKKPVEIEAVQFTGHNYDRIASWMGAAALVAELRGPSGLASTSRAKHLTVGVCAVAADALEAQAARIARLEAAIRAALHRATMRSSPDYELEDVLNGGTDG